MKLDLDKAGGNVIRGFADGMVLIGAEAVRPPLVLTVDRLVADWSPSPVGKLSLEDMQPVLALEPEVILLGTGERQCMPPMALVSAILRLGVGFEFMSTAAACRTFNIMVSEYRRVAAAIVTA